MHFLQNLFAAPLELILGPKRFIEDMWGESDRSRALLLGFPAILISLLGVSIIAAAYFRMSHLEDGYVAAMERVSEERQKLEKDVIKTQRLNKVANNTEAGGTDENTEVQAKLDLLRNEEDIYLSKLISMNPREPEYRFRLAMAKLRTDLGQGVSILKSLAPEEEAGYSKAHRFLANYYVNLRAPTQIEAKKNAKLALTHAEYCLKRDKGDSLAKAIKAQLLMNEQQLGEAYRLFSELFEEQPGFYNRLIQINEELGRQDRNESILERALLSYNEKLTREKLNSQDWVAVWEQMTGCYQALKQYDEAVRILEREINRLSQGGDAEDSVDLQQTVRSRRVFLQKRLASIYLAWAGEFMSPEDATAADKLQALGYAKEAYRLLPTKPEVLRMLTRLVTDKNPEVSASAKEVYDPYSHFAAPSSVLNELGAAAMKEGNFSAAVRFFELAKKKDPSNPMILNNLSYSWLRSEDQDANRALQLVDTGLRLIANNPRVWGRFRSNFLDTRGNALVQLERYEEAIAAFEQALTTRPNDIGLLKQLVECYKKAELDPTVLINRIERLKNIN